MHANPDSKSRYLLEPCLPALLQCNEIKTLTHHVGMMALAASFGPGTKYSSRGSWL